MAIPKAGDDGWAFLVDAFPHLYAAEPTIIPHPDEAEGQLSLGLTMKEVG